MNITSGDMLKTKSVLVPPGGDFGFRPSGSPLSSSNREDEDEEEKRHLGTSREGVKPSLPGVMN